MQDRAIAAWTPAPQRRRDLVEKLISAPAHPSRRVERLRTHTGELASRDHVIDDEIGGHLHAATLRFEERHARPVRRPHDRGRTSSEVGQLMTCPIEELDPSFLEIRSDLGQAANATLVRRERNEGLVW